MNRTFPPYFLKTVSTFQPFNMFVAGIPSSMIDLSFRKIPSNMIELLHGEIPSKPRQNMDIPTVAIATNKRLPG